MGEVAKSLGLSLLAGFVYIYTSYYRRFAWERLKVDRFTLFALACSFLFYLAGVAVSNIFPDWTPASVVAIRDDWAKVGVNAELINAIVVGFLIGWLENY